MNVRCSACGTYNKYVMRVDAWGRSYMECVSCQHNNKLPDPQPIGVTYATNTTNEISF